MFKPENLSYLRALHVSIFKRFRYTTDKDQFKKEEFWEWKDEWERQDVTIHGDCEEFAIVSMVMSRRAGYNARLVICKDEEGLGHLICEIADKELDQSVFFDNRSDALRVRTQYTNYKFLVVSPWNPKPKDDRKWKRVLP